MPKPSTEALIEAIRRESLPPDHEWDERGSALLALAEAQAADIDRLEAEIAKNGVPVGAIAEVRQSRVALARILGRVELPGSPATATVHARKAARARWSKAS